MEKNKIYKDNRQTELKIYGQQTCLINFEKDPESLIKVYIHEDHLKKYSKILKYCAEKKLSYRLIKNLDEFAKITDSVHHEGLCFLIRKKHPISLENFLKKIPDSQKRVCLVALENVANPHNLGAIVRVCANFGVSGLLLENATSIQTGSAYRNAEGGFEFLPMIEAKNLKQAMQSLKDASFKIYTTSSHSGRSISNEKFSQKSVFVFGSEREGLSFEIMRAGHEMVSIPSTGHVESLNVACAASVVLNEYRRHYIKN